MSSYLKKKSLVVCYQGILEKNGAWLNLFIYWPILPNFGHFWPILVNFDQFWPIWLATTHFALKIVKSVVNQPRKSMK